jgi:adenosylmethionine-8-amino-7-oxononanoate aminotransferase
LLKAAVGMGYRLERGLRAIQSDGGVAEVRGDVAVWAVGLRDDQDAAHVRDTMIANGVITRAIGANTITYCPPLVTTDAQIDTVIDVLAEAVS